MIRAGLHLTERGAPVGEGKIELFRNGQQLTVVQHLSVILQIDEVDFCQQITLSEMLSEKDQTSGFYPHGNEQIAPHIAFQLPQAMVQFLTRQLKIPPVVLQESAAFETDQTSITLSPDAGALSVRFQTGELLSLQVQRMAIFANHSTGALELDVRADLKSVDKSDLDADYQLRSGFVINRETLDMRFAGVVGNAPDASGLSRYYPGDEVQTDIANMNIKHPLVYNTGGTFALSSEGVHGMDFTQDGVRIQPVKLKGWGWGSVYAVDMVRGCDELHLVGLTKRYLETHLNALGWIEDGVLRSQLARTTGVIGVYREQEDEDGHGALNVRDVESLMLDITVDRFGLTMALDGKLSKVRPETRNDNHKPVQGPRYAKTLLLPWEVLRLRGFSLPRFDEMWSAQRHQTSMTNNFASQFFEKRRDRQKALPIRL